GRREDRRHQRRSPRCPTTFVLQTGKDACTELGWCRFARLAVEELTELPLAPREAGAVTALDGVGIGTGHVTDRKLAVHVRMQASLELLAIHSSPSRNLDHARTDSVLDAGGAGPSKSWT